MTTKRQDSKPNVILPFWKKDGDKYYADKVGLQEAIEASGATEMQLRRRLGHGYDELQEALEGKPVSGWSAVFIEDAFFRPHWTEKDYPC